MRRKAVTVTQIQNLDRLAINVYGVPSLILMENAGAAVAREAARMAGQKAAAVTVLCGTGNNGGDGFVAARHLANAGLDVTVFITGDPGRLKPDAAVNYRMLPLCGIKARKLLRVTPAVIRQMRRSAICIDALFGVGLAREIVSPQREIIEALNSAARRVLAADIPSGLNGTTGKVCGVCVRAHVTVTMSIPKTGFYRNAGPAHCGRIVTVDIGIPRRLMARVIR